ncbi:hypothetical protein CAEBREN_20103 [Caenorhabditis brenneri]|uniref:Uncharacterized protein n=1 Tax=Caenorhabditis brenneri TaxID=135651 RepID=G0NS42_CAEBE|nr:hypothetical protein CAEBREN_20103 [Caenorhabditis brenneri]
MSYRVSITTGQ